MIAKKAVDMIRGIDSVKQIRKKLLNVWRFKNKSEFSQLMRLWYLSHRRPAKAQASTLIRAVSPQPSLFAHMKYGCRQRVQPKIRHPASLDGCACAVEKWVYGGRKVPCSHEMAHWMSEVLKNSELFFLPRQNRLSKSTHKWAATRHNQPNECAPSEDSDQPGHLLSLIRVFAVRMKKAWCLNYLLSGQRRLIRLRGCPGWSESSLGAQSFCCFFSWGGSNTIIQYPFEWKPLLLFLGLSCCLNIRNVSWKYNNNSTGWSA